MAKPTEEQLARTRIALQGFRLEYTRALDQRRNRLMDMFPGLSPSAADTLGAQLQEFSLRFVNDDTALSSYIEDFIKAWSAPVEAGNGD